MNDFELRDKLFVLLTCLTDRFADDLARIVVDSVEIDLETMSVSYRLLKKDGLVETIGAKQTVKNELAECWIEYHKRKQV